MEVIIHEASGVEYEHDKSDKSPLGLFYNARFNEDTEANLSLLDEKYSNCLRKFSIIFSSSEISVYKILHYFYDKFGLREYNIKTLDGMAIESYFDANANHKYNMIQMKNLLENGVLSDIGSKWLVIPNMTSQWTPKLAYFFYNEIKEAGALGIIFNSKGVNNFGEILTTKTYLDILQFPKVLYSQRKKIQNDGY